MIIAISFFFTYLDILFWYINRIFYNIIEPKDQVSRYMYGKFTQVLLLIE